MRYDSISRTYRQRHETGNTSHHGELEDQFDAQQYRQEVLADMKSFVASYGPVTDIERFLLEGRSTEPAYAKYVSLRLREQKDKDVGTIISERIALESVGGSLDTLEEYLLGDQEITDQELGVRKGLLQELKQR